jgi:hypothetical protein
MPEMLTPTSAIMGAGLGKDVALITDGRFSGGSHGFIVGHITPEAQEGGPIALVSEMMTALRLTPLGQRRRQELAEVVLQLGVRIAVDVEHVAGLIELPGDVLVHLRGSVPCD